MNEEEIGTTDRNGNLVLAPVCLVNKAEKTKGITIGCINKNIDQNNNVADERNINNMNHIITTTIASKTLETTDNREIQLNNITISSVGESLPLSGVISIETTG